MSKYAALKDRLLHLGADRTTMSLEEIAAIVPGGLPPSAYDHNAWWANEESGSHSHARSWLSAGFRTTGVNLTARRVTFVRDPSAQPRDAKGAA